MHKCETCQYETSKVTDYNKHMATIKHTIKVKGLKCIYCDTSFYDKTKLTQHFRNEHQFTLSENELDINFYKLYYIYHNKLLLQNDKTPQEIIDLYNIDNTEKFTSFLTQIIKQNQLYLNFGLLLIHIKDNLEYWKKLQNFIQNTCLVSIHYKILLDNIELYKKFLRNVIYETPNVNDNYYNSYQLVIDLFYPSFKNSLMNVVFYDSLDAKKFYDEKSNGMNIKKKQNFILRMIFEDKIIDYLPKFLSICSTQDFQFLLKLFRSAHMNIIQKNVLKLILVQYNSKKNKLKILKEFD